MGDLRFFTCPLSYITGDTREIISLVQAIDESKQLLFEGGWGAQPYWLFEAYGIYKVEVLNTLKKRGDDGR